MKIRVVDKNIQSLSSSCSCTFPPPEASFWKGYEPLAYLPDSRAEGSKLIKVWGSLGPSEAGTACTAAQEV
jgi:hypothetical protein